MYRCTRRIHLLLVFFAGCFQACLSSDDINFADLEGRYAGQTVFNFLTIPVSANQLSLGIIASPGNMDATDVPLAPSATAFLSQYAFSITHLEWLMGLRKEYVGACFPLLDRGTIGLHSQVFTLGKFEYARDIDEYISEPKAAEIAVGASYARQIIQKKLSAGITTSYIESRLSGEDARAFNCAADVLYKPLRWLSSHGYVRNVGSKVKYNNLSESQPLQTGVSLAVSPFMIRDTSRGGKIDIAVAVGVQKTVDAPLQIGTGIDIKIIDPLHIKTGYEHFYGHDFSVGGLSAGMGLNVKQYGIDAGWKYQSKDFGFVWAVTIRYATEELVPKTALEYYKIALRYFNKERFRTCILYAKKALHLNPNMWRAHTLLAKAISKIHRERGTEIVLIYTGNCKGQFLPVISKGASLGGLARQKTVIDKIRKEYPISIAVDGGNILQKTMSIYKAQLADHYYRAVGYDLVGLGTGEIEFDISHYCEKEKQSGLKFFCSNFAKEVSEDLIDSKIISKGKYKIALVYAAPASLLQKDINSESYLSRTTRLTQYFQSNRIRMCHLRILILDDTWDNMQYFAKNVANIDFILCSSVKQHFETPMKVESTAFLSTGEYGKYIGALEIRFDRNKKLSNYTNKLIPVTEDITPDVEIANLIKKLALKGEFDTLGLASKAVKSGKTAGVFVFLTDRRGGSNIYLKLLKDKHEIPLTTGTTRCSKPFISFKNEKIVYLSESTTSSSTDLMIMDIPGAKKEKIDLGGSLAEIAFTPDEKWLYTSVIIDENNRYDIYRINPQGGEPQPIITWKDGSERDITFSSDGKNMLFTSDRDGTRQLYICDTTGENPLRLSDDASHHYQPLFSPNNMYIAYLSEKNNFRGEKDLWILDRNTGITTRLTKNAGVQEFLWLNDKGIILYSSGVNLFDFNTIDIFSKENAKLIKASYKKNYTEANPIIIKFNEKERILYERRYLNGARKLFLVNPDGSNDRQVTLDKGNCWLQ